MSAPAVPRTGSAACGRPWPPPAPCRAAPSSAPRCDRPHPAGTCATPLRCRGRGSPFDAPESAVAALELEDGLGEVVAAEVGPQDVGEDQLAIGQLPEKEVGDAVLARGADDEVGVRHLGVVEVPANGLLVDVAGPGAG